MKRWEKVLLLFLFLFDLLESTGDSFSVERTDTLVILSVYFKLYVSFLYFCLIGNFSFPASILVTLLTQNVQTESNKNRICGWKMFVRIGCVNSLTAALRVMFPFFFIRGWRGASCKTSSLPSRLPANHSWQELRSVLTPADLCLLLCCCCCCCCLFFSLFWRHLWSALCFFTVTDV